MDQAKSCFLAVNYWMGKFDEDIFTIGSKKYIHSSELRIKKNLSLGACKQMHN